MSMSKRDFIKLADSIKPLLPRDSLGRILPADKLSEQQWVNRNVVLAVCDCVADFCAQSNPRFNRERWLGYIRGENGPSGGEVKRDNRPSWEREEYLDQASQNDTRFGGTLDETGE